MKGFIIKCGMITAAFGMCLTGCGTPMLSLTSEEESIIVTYASGAVAKANKYMEQGMTYPIPEEEVEEPEVQEEPGENPENEESKENPKQPDGGQVQEENPDNNAETAVSEVTLAEFLGQESVTAEYQGYQITKNYVEGNYFALNAPEGKTYMIMGIQLTNTSEQPAECNMFQKNVNCNLYLNGESVAESMATVLLNDFTTYINTIEAGTTENTVIIFEVPEKAVEKVETLHIDIESEGNTYRVNLE